MTGDRGLPEWTAAVAWAGTPGRLDGAVILGLAAQVGNSGVRQLVLDIRVHLDLSSVVPGGLYRECG
jgi:hypothetical protein